VGRGGRKQSDVLRTCSESSISLSLMNDQRTSCLLRSQSKPEAGDVKKISQLDKDVATLSKGLVQLQKESSSIETKIKALQEKILEVGGVKLRSQQTKVQDLRSRISLANDRLTKSEVGRAKSEKDAIKLGKAIEANNLALKLAEGELEHLTTQISDGAATSSTVRKAVEQSKVVLDEKVEELAEMKKDLDDKVDMITQFKKREVSRASSSL
jgi:structural maintenance of chromosome 4